MNTDELLNRFEKVGRVALTAEDADFAATVPAVLEGIAKGYWRLEALHRALQSSDGSPDMILITDLFPSGNRRLQELPKL